MEDTGKNLESIQEMNRTLILKLLQRNRLCSRARLAKQSGLKQATITNIINDFISWDIVRETGSIEGKKGRRSIGLTINDQKFFVVGVRLTRRFYSVGLFNIVGDEILLYKKEQVPGTGLTLLLHRIKKDIKDLIAGNPDKHIVAIGVAVPGPYYSKVGEIEPVADFPGWERISLKEELQKGFDVPVVVDHDANAGVLAECTLSSEPHDDDTIVYVAVGQGIGSGIYHKGEIMKGSQGIAGEIGHTSIMFNGLRCECGNRGCLTLYASSIAFLNLALKERQTCADGDTSLPMEFDFAMLAKAVREKDKFAYRIFKKVMKYLGAGITNIIYSYNPSLIIIGDEVSEIGLPVVEELEKLISKLTIKRVINQLEIRLTSFDKDPAYYGAAALAINRAFSMPLLFSDSKDA